MIPQWVKSSFLQYRDHLSRVSWPYHLLLITSAPCSLWHVTHWDIATYTIIYSYTKSSCAWYVFLCPSSQLSRLWQEEGLRITEEKVLTSHPPTNCSSILFFLIWALLIIHPHDSPVLQHIYHTNRNYLLFLSHFQRGHISISCS